MRSTSSAPLGVLVPLLVASAACVRSSPDATVEVAASSAGLPSPGLHLGPFPEVLEDGHFGGQLGAFHVWEVRWGRLVDIYDRHPQTGERRLCLPRFVIGEDVASDGEDYELRSYFGNDHVELTILHPRGSAAFAEALERLQHAMPVLYDRSLDPDELPPFSMVPRNAALEIQFDDLLQPDSIGPDTVRVVAGYPPDQPFHGRVFADPNHGDLADPDGDGVLEFFPTRVIVDLAVGELDAAASDPPLALQPLGLPRATTSLVANAGLRIPTEPDPASGQVRVLTNLAGNALDFGDNGSNDPGSPTLDVVRAFRSGGEFESLGDLFHGFLRDDEPPRLVGRFPALALGVPQEDPLRPGVFTFTSLEHAGPTCTPAPEPGDELVIAGGTFCIVEGFSHQAGSSILKPRVRVVHPPGATPPEGEAILVTSFDPELADCFLAFDPPPTEPGNEGVSPAARIEVAFDEPMLPSSMDAFDGLAVTSVPGDAAPPEFVAAGVWAAADGRRFVLSPLAPLAHAEGVDEPYYVRVGAGFGGATDLAGNALSTPLPPFEFRIAPSAASVQSGSFVLRFNSLDELYQDGLPELRGQFVFDAVAGAIRPRPVNRYSISADTDKPVPSVMTPFGPGVQTPLSPLGGKLQGLWRYCDLGFHALDETTVNIDVEGMAWAPVGGQVVTDLYDEFRIALAHSRWLPDEALNSMTGFPFYPASGLVRTYSRNFISSEPDPGTVVHPAHRGYLVNPSDLFTAQSGKLMLPWPMNRGIPVSEYAYYTWRDTAILDRAGESTSGVPLFQEVNVLGLPPGSQGSIYPPGQVRTIGLPLLIEYRCYPDSSALGLNAFEIALAANSSSVPNFRAFSVGGYDALGTPVVVDPDLAFEASGGFNPNSNPPGQPTLSVDNVFFHGQLELVTRVSRVHSVWFPMGAPDAHFLPPIVLPDPSAQPAGTQVQLAYRGLRSLVVPADPSNPTTDAGVLDPYGDPLPEVELATAAGGDPPWRDDLAKLDGSSWVQLRISFVSNAATGAVPELSALGFSWVR